MTQLARIEPIDTGRNGGVSGKDRARTGLRERRIKTQALTHELADAFEAEEARVPLVEVEDVSLAAPLKLGKPLDGSHAADAEHDLLFNAVEVVATVKAVGDLTGTLVVAFNIRIEEKQRDAPHLCLPQSDRDDPLAGERDIHAHLVTVGIRHGHDREILSDVLLVVFLLPAFAVERLGEVAPLIKQTHADEIDAEIRGGLQVVTGEDAETTRVDREGWGDAELHREVRDCRSGRHLFLEPALTCHVSVEILETVLKGRAELRISRNLAVAARGHHPELHNGIAVALLVCTRIERLEKVAGFGVPGPPKVVGEGTEPLELGGEF